MLERRIGKFYVSRDAVWSGDFLPVLKALDFIPMRAEYLDYKNVFEYIGYSPLFEVKKIGDEVSEYEIIVHKTEDGSLSVEAKIII